MKVNIGPYRNGSPKPRKIEVTIHGYDTYSMCNTLAYIILPMLIQLKAEKHGVPYEFTHVGGENHDSQYSFDFYTESQSEVFDTGCDRWDDVLDKMIWSFQQLVDENYDSQYHHGQGDYDFIEIDDTTLNPFTGKDEKMSQMVDKNPTKHWYDHEGHMLHEARIQEGLELFGKYFQNLWD